MYSKYQEVCIRIGRKAHDFFKTPTATTVLSFINKGNSIENEAEKNS